jgi:hypothetical protein
MLNLETVPDCAAWGNSESILSRIGELEKNFVLWKRNLPNFLDTWAQEIKWEKIHPLDTTLTKDDLLTFEDDLRSEVRLWRKGEPDLTNWFVDDVHSLLTYFFKLSYAAEVRFVLEAIHDDKCRRFHFDQNHSRLLCTYVGAGTLWVPAANVNRQSLLGSGVNEDIVLDPLHVYQAQTLDVLILKGEEYPNNILGGAVHRSPTIKEGENRLLLRIDFKQ